MSARRRWAAVLLTLGLAAAALVATGVLPRLAVTSARADEVTASQNNMRTGWDPSEPGLAPAADGGPVGGPEFGQLFETHLDGQVYAQPVVAGQLLIVATETNHVYGLNAVTGAIEWSDFLGPAEPSSAVACDDLTPDVGITGTPVYDSSTGTVYLAAVVNDGPTPSQPHVYAYALDAQTGATLPSWPVSIQGSPVNEPGVTFNPLSERQRVGLLLLNGWIYMAFAGYCDYQPYVGYVAGVNTSTRALTLWSDETGLADREGGIWQSGGGLMSDGSGRIFLSTGNGVSPAPGPGTTPPPELGDSVVRLNVGSDGTLSAADFFSPANAPALDAADRDFGSGGPVALPFGSVGYPDLLVQAGKDGRLFMLDGTNLGGREQGAGGTDQVVGVSGPYGGLYGHPAAFGPDSTAAAATSDDYLYYVGSGDSMRYLQFGVNGSGTPTLTDVANSSTKFGITSGSPVVTSNGIDPASAVVWEVYAAGTGGASGMLQAYAAEPPAACTQPCTMSPIWSAPIGTASKFTIPATDSGRVYVGTRDGNVFGFGSPDAAPLDSVPVNFGQVAVGGTSTVTATLTASAAVTVSGVSVAQPANQSPFAAGALTVNGSPATLPVSLVPGDKLAVPVTFTPSSAGGVTGAVQVATDAANFPTVSVSLTGQGTAPGLQATPATVTFSPTPDHTTATQSVLLTNWSTGTQTITATTAPVAPFSATLPAKGKQLTPGQSIALQVSYQPTATGTSSSSFTIATSDGHLLTVPLSGTSVAAVSNLAASLHAVGFGSVQLGDQATQTVVITNSGNLPATISAIAGPSVPFGLQAAAPTGLPLNPGYTLSLPLSFTPTSTGNVSSAVTLNWSDALGRHGLTVSMAGAGTAPTAGHAAVSPPGGGWTFNGSAMMAGQQLKLTGAARQAGSALYAVPEPANGLTVSFRARLSGAGGMTLCLLDAAKARSTALGKSGGQFGFGGLPGVAVALGTARFSGDPGSNFVGIATSTRGGNLRYVRTSTHVPNLRRGSHLIAVTVHAGRVSVAVDHKQVLSARVRTSGFPDSERIGFTGGTGGASGTQTVGGVAIKPAGGQVLPMPGGGWWFNQSARMAGPVTLLTKAVKSTAGSVVYPIAVPTNGLTATFSARVYGGSDGQGMTFALLDPASARATSVGAPGAAQGVGGVRSVAVVINTVAGSKDQSNNQVEICTSTVGSSKLTVLQRAQAIPPIRPGPNTVTVQVSRAGGVDILTVWFDGSQILQQPVPTLTPTALLAFTGATGSRTDVHLLSDAALSTSP